MPTTPEVKLFLKNIFKLQAISIRAGEKIGEKANKGGISSYRWVVLAVFMVIALLSQLLWLT
ncbi:MAG: hypothetical protein ACTSQ8_23255, partial [Candidatus Helarchaeota archaeon]